MIDHDRLFKELLSTFLIEFIDLFLPEMVTYIDPESITFLDKEIFTDVTAGERSEADLVAQVQFKGKPSFFLIHIENQATAQADFGKRMFRYFARLYEKYDYPVYPIVLFSYDRPRTIAPSSFSVNFPDFSVLQFSYRVIQLNQLNWRDFLSQANPVASALMSKMAIETQDRPKVKAECLRLLVTLKLNPARMQLISGFVDTYLTLSAEEETQFKAEVQQVTPDTRGKLMEIVTSWQREGRKEGREENREIITKLILRLLERELGQLPNELVGKVQKLDSNELDRLEQQLTEIDTVNKLDSWLRALKVSEKFESDKAKVLAKLGRQVGTITSIQKQQLSQLTPAQWKRLEEAPLTSSEALNGWLLAQEP